MRAGSVIVIGLVIATMAGAGRFSAGGAPRLTLGLDLLFCLATATAVVAGVWLLQGSVAKAVHRQIDQLSRTDTGAAHQSGRSDANHRHSA